MKISSLETKVVIYFFFVGIFIFIPHAHAFCSSRSIPSMFSRLSDSKTLSSAKHWFVKFRPSIFRPLFSHFSFSKAYSKTVIKSSDYIVSSCLTPLPIYMGFYHYCSISVDALNQLWVSVNNQTFLQCTEDRLLLYLLKDLRKSTKSRTTGLLYSMLFQSSSNGHLFQIQYGSPPALVAGRNPFFFNKSWCYFC